MARPIYWPTNDSYVIGFGGRPYAGVPVRIWSRQTGGTQVTDLVYINPDGTNGAAVPSGVLVSDASGLIPAFGGPDNGANTLWGDHGQQGERIALTAGPGTGAPGVQSINGITGVISLDPTYAPGGTAGNINLAQAAGAAAGLAIVFGA